MRLTRSRTFNERKSKTGNEGMNNNAYFIGVNILSGEKLVKYVVKPSHELTRFT